MTRSSRLLLAAAAVAALCTAQAAIAQTQPPPPPPSGVYPPLQPAKPPHRVEISAYTGWMVNGDVDTSAGKLVIDDAQSFGAAISVQARPGTRAELSWTYSRNDAKIDSFSALFPTSQKFSVDTHYFQIGGLQSMKRGRVEPFGGATLGAVWYSPENIKLAVGNTTFSLSDAWRFAFTVGAGANVFLNKTESLALRLHAKMLVPVFFSSGGFYAGSGGAGVTVSGGIPAVSGDFGIGLVFSPR